MLPEIDETEHPILKIMYPTSMTVEECHRYCDLVDAIGTRRGAFVSIIDITKLSMSTSAQQRQILADRVDQMAAKGLIIAEIIVARTVLLRGLATAYEWLRKTKTPTVVCASVAEALPQAHRYIETHRGKASGAA